MALNPATSPTSGPRPLPRWLWIVLLLCAVHLGLNLLQLPADHALGGLLNNLVLEGLCLLGAGLFWRASRRADLPDGLRRSLRWAVVPILFQAAEGLVLLLIRFVGQFETRDRTWENVPLVLTDVLGQLSEIAVIVALLRMPAAQKPHRGPLRAVIDALTFVVGAGVPLWLFSLKPLWDISASTDDLFMVIGPITCFGGLLTLSWALETRAALPSRGANRILIFGTGMLLLADILYSIGRAGGLGDATLMQINMSLLHVAFASWVVAAWRCGEDPLDPGPRRSLVEFSPLPLITIVSAAAFFMLLMLAGNPDPALYPKVLVVLFLFLIILLARETFVIRDSLRLVAVEAGQKTQVRYEALVRHSTDMVVVVGADHRVRFASGAVQGVLGRSPEAIVGTDLLALIRPEKRAEAAAFLERLRREPTQPAMIQWDFSAADGTVRHLETVGSNLLQEPEVDGLVLNSRDVSERRHMEEQLRQSQKLDAIGQLAGGVAHDFNNILTAMQMHLALLREDHRRVPALVAGLDDLRQYADRAAGLTRQLLLFGRREMVQKQLLDLDALLGNLLKMLRRLIGENITMEFRSAAPGTWVLADAGMIEQVVMNLVVNARDALPQGGRITLQTGAVEIQRAAEDHPEGRPGRFILLTVADTGHGMAPATILRIFEPFFTTKELGRGTGLGLATAYGIVKQHDGWLEVESAVGRGTQFHVYLPAAAAPAAPAATLPSSAFPAPVGGLGTVLLVEDDTAVRQLSLNVLRQAGYAVLQAASGPEAVERWAARRGQIDLLLTDMVMPGGMSGLELGQRLRRDQPALKVIVMSGYSAELSQRGLDAEPQVHFLGKPFAGDTLLQLVRGVLAH